MATLQTDTNDLALTPAELGRYKPDSRASDALLDRLAKLLCEHQPQSILETGPGASSILFHRYAQSRSVDYWSVDQVGSWHDVFIKHLTDLKLPTDKCLETAIVDDYYDPAVTAKLPQKPFELVFLDGPAGSVGRSCEATLKLVDKHVGENTIVVQDDTDRWIDVRTIQHLVNRFGCDHFRFETIQDSDRLRMSTVMIPQALCSPPGTVGIPRIIHQIWFGPATRPTKWMDSWSRVCPGWEYRLWTEENMPKLRNARQFAVTPSWNGKANILRYELLYQYGGFYLDADTLALKSLDQLTNTNFIVVCDRDPSESSLGHYNNCVMACSPGHPLMLEIMYELAATKLCKFKRRLQSWVYSGPELVTRVVQKKADQALILPRATFMPETDEERKYAFADHYWATTKNAWARGVAESSAPVPAGSAVKDYWDGRYRQGKLGSGSGPTRDAHINITSQFVADAITKYEISSIVEFGCGDGDQLAAVQQKLGKLPQYVGLDISDVAIARRKVDERFSGMQFSVYCPSTFDSTVQELQADAVLSVDVIYHLTDDALFDTYMGHLLDCSRRVALIYSTDHSHENTDPRSSHIQHRIFTDWIEKNRPAWRLEEEIPTPKLSAARFFVFVKG